MFNLFVIEQNEENQIIAHEKLEAHASDSGYIIRDFLPVKSAYDVVLGQMIYRYDAYGVKK